MKKENKNDQQNIMRSIKDLATRKSITLKLVLLHPFESCTIITMTWLNGRKYLCHKEKFKIDSLNIFTSLLLEKTPKLQTLYYRLRYFAVQ
jgi:hypothetical protein